MFTDKSKFGMAFDYGGAWIHSASRHPIFPLAQEWHFTLQYQNEAEIDRAFYNGHKLDDKDMARLQEADNKIIKDIGALARQKDTATSEVLPPHPSQAERIAATFIGPMDAAVDLRWLSTADYAGFASPEPNFLVKEGFGTIYERYGKDLPVMLNKRVRAIQYDDKGVRVLMAGDQIAARAVIVTVSTGVLASGTIGFSPPLPTATNAAIDALPMGLLTKVPMQVRDRTKFDLKPGSNVVLERDGLDDAYLLAFPFDSDLLVGFIGGDFAWQKSKEGNDGGKAATIEFMRDTVRQSFGNDAANAIALTDVTDWATNPLTLGAYSAARPGHADARKALAEPLDNRVFLAGEAMGEDLSQTSAGAMLSGTATAARVHRALGA